MKSIRIFMALIMLSFVFTSIVHSADKVVTVADMEKVSGLTGIKVIPKDPYIGAGGDINFAKKDGKIVLIVMNRDKAYLTDMKAQKGSFDKQLNGIGDEAYDGPGFGKIRYILAFRKGNRVVVLSSFMDMDAGGKPFFTPEKLKKLADIALTRM
jgi:hypothetical protein